MRRDDDNDDGVSIDARPRLVSLTPTRQFGRDTLMRWSLDPLRDGRIWPGQSQLHADFPVGTLTVVSSVRWVLHGQIVGTVGDDEAWLE